MMRVEYVEIENIKGIEKLRFELGALTVVSGDNGMGKSSILDAVAAVFEGGHDPSLIRQGEKKAIVEIGLSGGITITKTIVYKSSELVVKTADGSVVSKPKTFVDELAHGFAFDPIAFLTAPEKDRARYLLEAMPIIFTPVEIENATGNNYHEGIKPAQLLDLSGFGNLRQGAYDRRRDANVSLRDLNGTIETLKSQLPDDDETDHVAKAAAMRSELGAKEQERKNQIDLADAWHAAEMAKLQQRFTELKAEIGERRTAMISENTAVLAAECDQLRGDLREVDEKARVQAKAKMLKQELDRYKRLRDEKDMEAGWLAYQLEQLDKLREKKLAETPIPGLVVADGRVTYEGLPFDQINTQKQYFLAFQLAALKIGNLGFMVCDRVESIVGEQWEDFKAAAKASGFQVLVARAEAERPLTVEVA